MKNYKPSKVQTKCECFICHAPYTVGLEHHHLLHGTGQRKLADEDALWIWCCRKCHSDLHDHNKHDKELQALGQRVFIEEKMKEGYSEGQSRGMWFNRYGKFYDI